MADGQYVIGQTSKACADFVGNMENIRGMIEEGIFKNVEEVKAFWHGEVLPEGF